MSLFFAFIGAMEFGFLYTTMISMLLMGYAFNEMMSLRARKDKESQIQIKSFWVEWYFFIAFNFYIIGKTWMTPQLLHDSGIALDPYGLASVLLIKQHALCSFMMFTFGIIFFVFSLQEGYYSYQVQRFGLTLAFTLILCTSFHGHLTGLWKCRIWFIFPIATIALRNALEYLVEKYCPFRTKIYDLKPKATMEGFVAGVVAALVFNFTLGQAILKSEWARAMPTKLSLTPFDKSSYTLAEGGLWETRNFDLHLASFQVTLTYSQIQIYLFVISLFVAFISPFGGFAIAGLKRALRSRENRMRHGQVIDRLDCILLVGFFMMIFTNKIVYQDKSVAQVAAMVQALSPEAKVFLREKLQKSGMLTEI